MRYTAWLAAIVLNAFVATWVAGVNMLWRPAGAFPGAWVLYALPPVLAVASLLWQRTRPSVVWTAALVTNMLLTTWLVIGFATVLPQPGGYLWGYSSVLVALPSMLAVIAHVWPREHRPRRTALMTVIAIGLLAAQAPVSTCWSA
jgi:hypothetical protein